MASCGEDVKIFFDRKILVDHIDTCRGAGGVKESGGQPGFALDTAGEEDVVIVGCGRNNFGIGLCAVPVELGPSGLTFGEGTGVIAESRDSGNAQSDLRIKSRSGNGLSAALAGAGNHQRLAIPFGAGLDVIKRAHHPQIHAVEIDFFTVIFAAVVVIFQSGGSEFLIEGTIFAVGNTVGIDVHRDGIFIGADPAGADAGTLIRDHSRKGFGLGVDRDAKVAGNRHAACAVDLDIIEFEAFGSFCI